MKPIVSRITELINYLKQRKNMIEQGLTQQNDNQFQEKLIMFTRFKLQDEQEKAFKLKQPPTRKVDQIKRKQSEEQRSHAKIASRQVVLDEILIEGEDIEGSRTAMRKKFSSNNRLTLGVKGKRRTNQSFESSIGKRSIRSKHSGQIDYMMSNRGFDVSKPLEEVEELNLESTPVANPLRSLNNSGKKIHSLFQQSSLPPITVPKSSPLVFIEDVSSPGLNESGTQRNYSDRYRSEMVDSSSIREEDSDEKKEGDQQAFRNKALSGIPDCGGAKKRPRVHSPLMKNKVNTKQTSFRLTTQKITSLELDDQVSVHVVRTMKKQKTKELNERGRIRIRDKFRQDSFFSYSNASRSQQIPLEDVAAIDEEAPY
ncbi:hypothetical protein FGO68_gene130 [Halteria grandinella]|uniref:Uncharacterized protein n=1 Tax=Halteria grandinella TaxID=5974 RepID=A0A8J8SW70_HALGN|nr:hypothetical protein FGO68_gene130 [Halteria grandinella]